MRARILAGAATFTVAVMALPSEAAAQIGACPTLQPPPCIVISPQAIAQHVAEINQKRQELEQAVNTVRQYTDMNNVLGRMGDLVQEAPAPAGWRPLDPGLQLTTVSDAANRMDAYLSANPNTVEGDRLTSQQDLLRQRAAAGEGYAAALAIKSRMSTMGEEAQQLCRVIVTTGGEGDPDLRSTWQINRNARALMLRAIAANREVSTAQLNLMAMRAVSGTPSDGNAKTRTEAAPIEPAQPPRFRLDLASLANAANRLASLYAAAQVARELQQGISGARATQEEHRTMVTAANQTQAALQQQATRDARRGVSASQLLQRADQVMAARDNTVWDDPSKRDVTRRAADFTKGQLDRLVGGDVSGNWIQLLINRAEAFKQEAFFRPIAEDAARMETQGREALAEYGRSLGVDPTNQAALQAAIREVEAEVSQLRESLTQAPADVVRQRDAIIASSGMQPAPPPQQ